MSTFSTALPCLGDTCKQGQKQAEKKTGGRKVSSLQKRSQSDTMRKQRMGGKTGNICRRFSKDFLALLLCSLHKRNPLLAKSWQWEKSTNWEGKQNSVEKWKDRFASRQVSLFFGTSVKFHGIETTWHWKLKNAHLTVFTRKPVVNPCQYMLWMCRRASGDKCKQALMPSSSSSFDSFMLINPQTFARHSAGKSTTASD